MFIVVNTARRNSSKNAILNVNGGLVAKTTTNICNSSAWPRRRTPQRLQLITSLTSFFLIFIAPLLFSDSVPVSGTPPCMSAMPQAANTKSLLINHSLCCEDSWGRRRCAWGRALGVNTPTTSPFAVQWAATTSPPHACLWTVARDAFICIFYIPSAFLRKNTRRKHFHLKRRPW